MINKITPKVAKILLVAIFAIIIFAFVYGIMRRRRNEEEIEEIYKAVNSDVGKLGEDVDTVLLPVKEDLNYKLSTADLNKLKSAKGAFYTPDNPNIIGTVLAGKSKPVIKAIFRQFTASTGTKFNDFLNSIFTDYVSYDTEGYKKILNIVKAARDK